jgi:DNA modification methylase
MKIEAIAIKDLVSDPSNARKHKEKNIEAIKGSLLKFGQQKPIVVNDKNIVIAGNGTLEAAKALGWDKLNVVRSGLDKLHQTAFAIADNRSSELAEWDIDVLGKSLDALEDDFDLEGLGFDEEDIAKLTPQVSAPGLIDDDELPETAKNEFGVVLGDIWQLGNHRVMCGDSTNIQHVERLMNGNKADMVFTDPPYGIGYEYNQHDDSSAEENEELVRNVFALHSCGKVWTPGLCNLSRDISRFGKTKVLVWYKKFAMAGSGLGGASTWEPVLVLDPQEKKLSNDVIEVMTDRETVGGVSLRKLHSCPKPVGLFEILIKATSKLKAYIFEPFCGSGSTLIACEKTNRTCYGMEIDPHYCSVIIKRWQDFTGKTAVRVTDEKQSIKPTKSKKLGTNAKEAF